jgi:hypothetical protein
MIQATGLPIDIIVSIASLHWRTWANLVLADPVFCKWAADPVQIARFMRTFIVNQLYVAIDEDIEIYHTLLCDQDNVQGWFGYPSAFTLDTLEEIYDINYNGIIRNINSHGVRVYDISNPSSINCVDSRYNVYYYKADGFPMMYGEKCIWYHHDEPIYLIENNGMRLNVHNNRIDPNRLM